MDLVVILNDSCNHQIMKTNFVSSLLSGNWEKYYTKIYKTQFWPYIFYFVSMTNFYVLVLQESFFEGLDKFNLFTLNWGFCAMLSCN